MSLCSLCSRQTQNHQDRMSYGSIDGGSFGGSRNPFGGPKRQGYQPVATQVSSSELQDVFQETSSNIFQINANGESCKYDCVCSCVCACVPVSFLLYF
uniref:Uncharacterized protein n=1 Tax=Hucho hucho TaxID=62062 RepID=A0A4W5MUL8_9TELE